MEGPLIPFGKHKGQSLAHVKQNFPGYIDWCMTQPPLSKIIKELLEKNNASIINIFSAPQTTDSCTPEHNKMQARFLLKGVQNNLITHVNLNCFSRRMNSIIKSEQFLAKFQPHADIVENMERVIVKFEDCFNWDVTLTSTDGIYEFIPHLDKLEQLKEMKIQLRTQHDLACAETHRLKLLEFEKIKDEADAKFTKDMKIYDERMAEYIHKLRPFEPFKPSPPSTYYFDCYMSEFEKLNETQFEKIWEKELNSFYHEMCKQFPTNVTTSLTNTYTIKCSHYDKWLYCCELKPLLGDDYPCVLRKMKHQMHQINSLGRNNSHRTSASLEKFYYSRFSILVVGEFNSIAIDKNVLKEIFKQSNIFVIFMDEIEATSTAQQLEESIECIDQRIKHLQNEKKRLSDSLDNLSKKPRSDE